MAQHPFPHAASGFSLVELAVSLTIIGVLLGASVGLMQPYYDDYRYSSTLTKLNRIADALSAYARIYNRLPCPADPGPVGIEPYGAPRQSGINGVITTNTCSGVPGTAYTEADYNGLVPFRALGLTEAQAKDSFGNFITYAVAPTLAGHVNGTNVHEQCRNNAWVSAGTNRNPTKARFCCPNYYAAATTVRVFDRNRNDVAAKLLFTGLQSPVAGRYASPDSAVPTTNPDNQLLAFALISHGKNGDGALLRSGTRRPITASVSVNAQEYFNRIGGLDFVSRPLTLSNDTSYFDDIVVWRSNVMVMAASGNSCASPRE